MGNQSGVSILDSRFKKAARSSGVLRWSCTSNFVVSRAISEFPRHFYGRRNIPALCGFVAAAEQKNNFLPLSREIQAISAAICDPRFADAFAGRLYVAEIAKLNTADANDDPLNGMA